MTPAEALVVAEASDWPRLPIGERSRRMLRWADALDPGSLAATESSETGKPLDQSAAEVESAIDTLRFYAGAARTMTAPAAGEYIAGYSSEVRLEPLGPVAAILPWNYPVVLAAWRIGPALAAGCPVVVKPDPTTPGTAIALARAAVRTLGPGALTTITGGDAIGRDLVRAGFAAVAFTGSVEAGRDVAANAGLARLSLELGGNNPVIVDEDYPEGTAAGILAAVTYNAGQSCAAPGRVYAVGSAYDSLRGQFEAAVSLAEVEATIHDADADARYRALIEGAVVVGEDSDGYPPVALLAVDEDAPAATTEVFGPAVVLLRADSVEDAVRRANASPYGLAGSVWTSSVETARRVARDLRVGEVWVNCHLVQTAELPHGGFGSSGSGTDMGRDAIREYQRTKTVTTSVGGP